MLDTEPSSRHCNHPLTIILNILRISFREFKTPLTGNTRIVQPRQLLNHTHISHSHTVYIHTRVGTLIVATIYLQLIQIRYMFRSFIVLHCSHQHCVQPVASDVEVVGYL